MTTFKQPQNQQETLSRAGCYAFYSGVLLREFNEETLEEMRRPDWESTLKALGVELPSAEQPNASTSVIEELAIDYCRIFIGPQDFCPPYQSVWESGSLQSRVIESMEGFLEIVNIDTGSTIKDHAGLQYEIMARILEFEAESHADSEGLAAVFFQAHVNWTEKMLNRAEILAETRFYKSLLSAARQFIEFEKTLYDDEFHAT